MSGHQNARTEPGGGQLGVVAPEISVIIPAGNAAATLPGTLRALQASTFGGVAEIIVVDDASTDGTPLIATAFGARMISTATQRGPAGARNAGVEASRAPLIAFTDADCEPAPGWLQAMADALRKADLVMGPVLPDPSAPRGHFDRTLDIAELSPRFETANLGVRRVLFDAVGGFEPFTPDLARRGLRPRPDQGHFGEDAVFGWRARRHGACVAFSEEAVVFHTVFPRGPRGYIAEKWRLRYFPALLEEVPELRRTIPLRLFLSRRTLSFDVALGGVAAALLFRRAWPLVACAYYARSYLRTTGLWRRSTARENLALVAGDTVGLLALVRGSAAARRPLL